MSNNPYSQLSGPKETEWETVYGAFRCDTCGKTVGRALYSDRDSVLTYKCPQTHINTVQDFHLD